jgi:hypothetical protein
MPDTAVEIADYDICWQQRFAEPCGRPTGMAE